MSQDNSPHSSGVVGYLTTLSQISIQCVNEGMLKTGQY